MRGKKTRTMKQAEARIGQTLEDYLPQALTDRQLTDVADELGVSKATLGYWLLKMGLTIRRVAVWDGETIRIEGRT